jgi:phage terminase Nu1 subunit (DNA packaging protein)
VTVVVSLLERGNRKRPMTIADGRRRLVHAQAKRAELRVARESGELVEVREVELRWSQLIVMARTKMLAIPRGSSSGCRI